MDVEQNDGLRVTVAVARNSRSPDLSTSTSSTASQSRSLKFIKSMVIYFSTFTYACGFSIIAPTIIDFSRKFETDVSHVSLVFSVITGSYLVGALTSGLVVNFIPHQIITICILSCASIALFLLPQAENINLFFMFASFIGFGGGGWDAIQIPYMIDIWRSEAPPFILSQHFSWSLGTILPPLILAPFLNDTSVENTTSKVNILDTSFAELELITDPINVVGDVAIPPIQNTITTTSKGNPKLYIPFSISGGLIGIAVTIQILLFVCTFNFRRLWRRQNQITRTRIIANDGDTERLLDEDNNEPIITEVDCPDQDQYQEEPVILTPLQQAANEKWRRILLIILSCCCIASYSGLEMCTMQFLPAFAVYSQHFTEAEGAQLLFACTIAYCICRGLGILLVLKVPPHFILFGNIILLFISNALLLFFTGNSATMLWIGSVLIGAAMSTTYPAYYAFIEKYIFVTNGVSTTITVSAGVVTAIYPMIVGRSVEKNPSVMIYVNFFSTFVLFVSFSITFWVTWWKCRREGGHGNGHGHSDGNKRD